MVSTKTNISKKILSDNNYEKIWSVDDFKKIGRLKQQTEQPEQHPPRININALHQRRLRISKNQGKAVHLEIPKGDFWRKLAKKCMQIDEIKVFVFNKLCNKSITRLVNP